MVARTVLFLLVVLPVSFLIVLTNNQQVVLVVWLIINK